jgi:serine/threonine protein kinase
MAAACADRNLLFGIVALQTSLVSREALAAALREWVKDKTRSLREIMAARKVLADDDQVLVEEVVERHVRDHNGDIESSLDALLPACALAAPPEDISDPAFQGQAANGAPGARVAGRSVAPVAGSAAERYELLWEHAKGGLGRVFVAEDKELHRRVALKEIRTAHARNPVSRQRFMVEAEITGNLEHPGIVPVYGLGAYRDGRPFYAMRFINGEDLMTAIRRVHGEAAPDFSGLEFRWLLRRFIDVCNTIAYAHSRGVLHRDLKPANIMLGPFGETLVMDWGVAKPMSKRPVETASDSAADGTGDVVDRHWDCRDSVTLPGQAVGTPSYMSPEQAAGRPGALGPASDVYSLGATLYVMLTGDRPFTGEPQEVINAVQDGRFPPPRTLNPRVPSALDAICRQAMALDPGERYQSALALADDIERWLADEPVWAWPAPWPDRARRWVRRHQVLVSGWAAAVGVAVVALALAVPVLSLAWRDEARARHQAEQQHVVALQQAAEADTQRARAVQNLSEADSQRAAAFAQETIAKQEKDRAEKALKFLVEAFRKPDPLADGGSLKVVDLLRQAVLDLEHSFPGQPLMKATLLSAIGQTYVGLGMAQESLWVFQRAFELRRKQLGEDQPETLESMHGLAQAYQDAGRLDKAIPILETTLAKRRQALGENHVETIESMNDLAVAYWEDGQSAKAIPLYELTLQKTTTKQGADHPDTLTIMDNLAVAYGAAGRHDEAIRLHETTLARLRAKLADDHLTVLIAMNNLARAYAGGDRNDAAIRLYEATLPKLRNKLNDNHPTTLIAMHGLGCAYRSSGKLAEAIPLLETTLEKRRAKLGHDHPDTLASLFALGDAYCAARQPEKGIPLAREFLLGAKKAQDRLPGKLRTLIPQATRLLSGTAKGSAP